MSRRTTGTTTLVVLAGLLAGWLAGSGRLARPASAQEKNGAAAPAPQGGTVLPRPPEPFKGTINLRAKDSKSDFPQPIQAPKGAPNILLVLLDDVGFGATSTFGGPCQTPTFTRLAEGGLKYN